MDLLPYAEAHSSQPDELRAEVARTTAARPDASMLSGPVEGELLAAFVHATRARRVLEVGTFTGYGALTMAGAMAPGGTVVTCELDPGNAEVAAAHFARSEFGDRIDLRVGPALATIASLDGPFDVAYVDADKGGYVDYYEAIVPLLSGNGVLLADNTTWRGEVLAPESHDARAIAAFNEHVAADPRTRVALLPFADGVTVAWRV